MDIITAIVEKIRTTPLPPLEPGQNVRVDSQKVFEKMNADMGYRVFMETLVILFDKANAGIGKKEQAAAVVLDAYESLLRYGIMKAIKAELTALGAEDLEALKLAYLSKDFEEKFLIATKKMDDLEAKKKLIESESPVDKFKYSLMYAVDRWGDDKDKKAVGILVGKIKDEPLKRIKK